MKLPGIFHLENLPGTVWIRAGCAAPYFDHLKAFRRFSVYVKLFPAFLLVGPERRLEKGLGVGGGGGSLILYLNNLPGGGGGR